MAGFPRNFGRLAPAALALAEAKAAARAAAAAVVVEAPAPVELRVEDIEDLPGPQQTLGPAPTVCDREGVEPQTDDDEAPVLDRPLAQRVDPVPTFMGDLPGSAPAPANKSPPPVRRPAGERPPMRAGFLPRNPGEMLPTPAAKVVAIPLPPPRRPYTPEENARRIKAAASLVDGVRGTRYPNSVPKPQPQPAQQPQPAPETASSGSGFGGLRRTAPVEAAPAAAGGVVEPLDGLPQPANPDDIPW